MIEEVLRIPDKTERRALLDVLALAFRDNPMNIEIHGPSPTKRVRANRAGLRSLVLDLALETETRVIYYNGKVAGGFVAAAPGVRTVSSPSLRRQFGCFIHQGARAMDRWGQVNRSLSTFRPARDHWYLSVLGVAPDLRGRGLGRQLLAGLFALSEQRPAPIYLESDREASVGFYRAHGFEDRREERVHGVLCRCLGRGFG